MFCKNCGANVDDKAVICPDCGRILSSPKKEEINSQIETPSVAQPPINQETADNQTKAQDNTPSETIPKPYVNEYNTNSRFNNAYNYSQYNKNPYAQQNANKSDGKGFAITSLVLSLVALPFCCCNFFVPFTPILPIMAILAIIFGILGIKSSLKGLSITGIILGAIGVLAFIMIACTIYFTPVGKEFSNSFWTEFDSEYQNTYNASGM